MCFWREKKLKIDHETCHISRKEFCYFTFTTTFLLPWILRQKNLMKVSDNKLPPLIRKPPKKKSGHVRTIKSRWCADQMEQLQRLDFSADSFRHWRPCLWLTRTEPRLSMKQLQKPDSPSRSQCATNNLESNGVYSGAGINHQRRQRRLRIDFPDSPNPISPFLPLAHIRVCGVWEWIWDHFILISK